MLVEVHGAGVCGTDLHIASDGYPTRPPVIMGHEVAGVVVGLGDDVDPAWLGARVACETHHQVCDCVYCRDGRRNLCFNKTSMGSFVDGGFASHVVVPATLLHRVPDGVSDHAAALTEPLACVCHLLLDPPVAGAGDRVLVTGPGPMGLLAAQVARACGATVTVVGLPADAPRLAVASGLGFATAHSADPESLRRRGRVLGQRRRGIGRPRGRTPGWALRVGRHLRPAGHPADGPGALQGAHRDVGVRRDRALVAAGAAPAGGRGGRPAPR